MNKEEAINEVALFRKVIDQRVEWNFGYMDDEAHKYLEKVQELEKTFNLPSSTPL